MSTNLDMDCLRTLVAVAETGTQAQAAARVGRTPSAVSLQMDRLADQARAPLLRKDGRRLAFTEAGERLLGYARRILEINDTAVAALDPGAVAGPIRFGAAQDFAESQLPAVLGRFAQRHPDARLDVRVEPSTNLNAALDRGELDLAVVAVDPGQEEYVRILFREPMIWIGRPGIDLPASDPVPLVLNTQPCIYHRITLDRLQRTGRPWRIAYVGPSVSAVRAAVKAGLGITVRWRFLLGDGLDRVPQEAALPELPEIVYGLRIATPTSPAAARLAEAVEAEWGTPAGIRAA